MATTPEISNTFEIYDSLESGEFARNESRHLLQRSRRTTRLLLVMTDLLMIWAASAVALAFRFSTMVRIGRAPSANSIFHIGVHAALLLLYSGLVVVSCYTHRLYRALPAGSTWHEAWAVVRAVAVATVLLSTLIFVLRAHQVSRVVVAGTGILSAGALILVRLARRKRLARRVAAGHDCRNVLIVGGGPVGRALEKHLNAQKHFGYLVKGFLDQRRKSETFSGPERRHAGDAQVLGSVDDLPNIARGHFIDEVLITVPNDRELVKRVAAEARECGLAVRVVPDLYDGLAWQAPIEYLGLFPMISLHHEPMRELELLLKRMIDVVGSSFALLCASPLIIAAACAIYFDNPGPIFYRSLRVGKKGKTFHCLKFRTMVVNADKLLDSLRHLNEREGLLFKINDDPRITRVGRLLRKYSIDEVPQFWNVLKGDMSLVGPRPPLATEFEKYDLEYFKRLEAVPGITGLWQVEARQSASFETYINLDLHYVENWSLLLDLKLLIKTIGVVFAGTGR